MATDSPDGFFTLPDLYEFPVGSLPSPYDFMDPVRRLRPGLRLFAIGWLDGPIEFPRGPTNPEIVAKLLALGDKYAIDEGMRGYHSCYYCRSEPGECGLGERWTYFKKRPRSPLSKGHHLVTSGDCVYMCPALLPHYIVAHEYRPPDVFQDAVMHGAFLRESDLLHTGEDFVQLMLTNRAAVADARGDVEAAADYRKRLEERREELRAAGKTTGFRDRDTGVWRDR